VRIVRHEHAARRGVAWIDMPDIDSTETRNRGIALAWLPHVDLLVYVVSPERYRDDAGWRVLRERGERHAWLFVMNHWDEGAAGQSEDFARLLRGAGFESPVLLHTSCASESVVRAGHAFRDDFAQLEEHITALLANHGADEVVRLGQRARLNDLRGALLAALPPFGDDERWARLREVVRAQWRQSRDAICAAADWPIAVAAGRLAVREGGFMRQVRGGLSLLRGIRGAAANAAAPDAAGAAATGPPATGNGTSGASRAPTSAADLAFLSDALWDDWPQAKLESFLDIVELESRRAGLAAAPPRRLVGERVAGARDAIARDAQQTVRSTLAHPGAAVQRLLRRITGFLMVFLPCVALFWIAYKVVLGFHAGGAAGQDYLGSSFAINAILLLAVAWGVPFTLDRLLRPSLEQALRRALRQSFDAAVDQLGNRMLECFGDAGREAAAQRAEAKAIADEIATAARGVTIATDTALSRIVTRASAGGVRDRRASEDVA
jgi:hypothetical protein